MQVCSDTNMLPGDMHAPTENTYTDAIRTASTGIITLGILSTPRAHANARGRMHIGALTSARGVNAGQGSMR